MTDKFEFQVGDIVSFGGIRGEVFKIDEIDQYPVRVRFELEKSHLVFTKDGKYFESHTKPLLELIERPKKKAKKTLEGWVNVWSGGVSYPIFHPSKAAADNVVNIHRRIACVKLTGEYEVEE